MAEARELCVKRQKEGKTPQSKDYYSTSYTPLEDHGKCTKDSAVAKYTVAHT